jgi:hypothetical protein
MAMGWLWMYLKCRKSFWEDLEGGSRYHSELEEKYADMWVAIVNRQVVFGGKDLAKVKREAQEKTRKNIPVIYVE